MSAGRLNTLYETYHEDVRFFVVYIREAHALDSPSPMTRRGPIVQDPINLEERQTLARQCATAMEIAQIPTLVDLIDDRAGSAYAAWPDRLFLVGRDGRIAYAGGRGPFGFKPDELAGAIEKELGRKGGAPADQDG